MRWRAQACPGCTRPPCFGGQATHVYRLQRLGARDHASSCPSLKFAGAADAGCAPVHRCTQGGKREACTPTYVGARLSALLCANRSQGQPRQLGHSNNERGVISVPSGIDLVAAASALKGWSVGDGNTNVPSSQLRRGRRGWWQRGDRVGSARVPGQVALGGKLQSLASLSAPTWGWATCSRPCPACCTPA